MFVMYTTEIGEVVASHGLCTVAYLGFQYGAKRRVGAEVVGCGDEFREGAGGGVDPLKIHGLTATPLQCHSATSSIPYLP